MDAGAWLVGLVAVAAAVVWALTQKPRSGRPGEAGTQAVAMPRINGDGRYSVEVVGESFSTAEFEALLGKRAYTDEEMFGDAVLTLDDTNPHDAQAVSVSVQGLKVGHLSRSMARTFRAALKRDGFAALSSVAVGCRIYCGGRDGLFSVTLDLPEA